MKSYFSDKNILITGGCGSVAKMLTEKLLEYEPQVIRLFDMNEESLFELRQQYSNTKNETKLRFLLGDIRNLTRLQYALTDIDIVFHTASYKHVQECEYNPIDAIDTNITGTTNLIQAAISQKVEKVIYTSTDKAVNPANTMGVTKLLAEKLIIAANQYGAKRIVFASCRFGNVLETSGSVIPLFKKQILEKKRITITDPEMTRFIITREKAVDLVLHSCEIAQGGEIFISRMDAIKIKDLAEAMIRKYGRATKEIIGKRPGEKQFEELMTEEEITRAYEGKDTYIVLVNSKDFDKNKYDNYKKVDKIFDSRKAKLLNRAEIMRLLK
jgi:FlaA1/EpsC-like NDP-sugar epimerase